MSFFLAIFVWLFGMGSLFAQEFPHNFSQSQPQKINAIEVDLRSYEQKVYSQNGEDGVLQQIFNLIGTTSEFFVEFGVEDGSECNTAFFRKDYGWAGLMLDSAYSNPCIGLFQERVTAENIVALFQKYRVPAEFDLLSVDIDLNDFYVWHALLPCYRPRVVVIEYNGVHLSSEDRVVTYLPEGCWDQTNFLAPVFLPIISLPGSMDIHLFMPKIEV